MGGVTPHGIRYPDGASKAKNLGPELKTMAEDIDFYIGSYLSPTGPIRQIIIGVAEEVVPPIVERELEEQLPAAVIEELRDFGMYWGDLDGYAFAMVSKAGQIAENAVDTSGQVPEWAARRIVARGGGGSII